MHHPETKPQKTLRDIRKPASSRHLVPKHEVAKNTGRRHRIPRQTFGIRIRLQPFAIGIAAALSFVFFSLFFFAHDTLATAAAIKAEIPALAGAARSLDTADLAKHLDIMAEEFSTLNSQIHFPGASLIAGAVDFFIPGTAMIPAAVAQGTVLNQRTADIARDFDLLKRNGLALATSGRGGELIAAIERIDDNLASLRQISGNLAGEADVLALHQGTLGMIAGSVSRQYNKVEPELAATASFMHGLRSLLEQTGDQHILVLFQNPTEIRPAGGFLGSYADVVISKGSITAINVDDIYNADRQLDRKIAPPAQLSNITPTWGARDANWFFDFPTSAQKVASLLEDSRLYASAKTTFGTVIAINTAVLQSILGITGPIDLPTYHLTVTEQNFLPELQREVESGPDKKPGQNPKHILSVLMPLLMEKIHALTDIQKSQFLATLAEHVRTKDIMAYASDWQIQSFLESAGVAGEIYALPDAFTGDYLAVVNANIAGGKTDAFIDQHVALTSTIGADGSVIDQLSVTHIFHAPTAADWYYRVANKDFIKILTPPTSELLAITGNDTAPAAILPAQDLAHDPDLSRIDKSAFLFQALQTLVGSESNKASFGAWMTTLPGSAKTLTAQYRSGRPRSIVHGTAYTLVLEKQSGVNTSVEYALTAPPGYFWRESGSPIFTYGTEQLKAREFITATLRRE